MSESSQADQLAVTTIRALAIDAVERAGSGHPGAPMGLAPLAYVLFTRHLAHNPDDPDWFDRDRFILSAGHASMLLYAMLHLTGYDLTLEDLQQFRQFESRTPGHPENFMTPGVETTTGPLGQGVGNAVGLALAERVMAARYNRPGHEVVDHRTWVIASDGDLMEGVASEACSLAGHLALERLVVFWDDNSVTLDGPASWSFSTEDVAKRFEAYGWRTLEVADGNDLDALDQVCKEAAVPDGRPTLVRVRTVIGYGAPTKAGSSKSHGSPLGPEEAEGAKRAYGWEHPPFTVPDEARAATDQRDRGRQLQDAWEARLGAYREAHPDLADEFERVLSGELPESWDADLPAADLGAAEATRKSSGKVLNALAARLPELLGGSADLASSNGTLIEGGGAIARGEYGGRNVNYGVREHAMASMMNGMALHGGVRPFGGTFLVFSDYLRPALRLAALMGSAVVFVLTHDSVALGEDGPTHQPVEHLAALRAIPNLVVLRPADAKEVAGAWAEAIARTDGPTVLALSRQDVPVLEGTDADAVGAGAYVVVEADDPDVVLVATGAEVSLAVEAARLLVEDDLTARVVSMPSWELFSEQDEDYQDEVLGVDAPVLSVEAATSFGWERWADEHVAVDGFGSSAPGTVVLEELGFTPGAVAEAARQLVEDTWAAEDDDEDEEDA